MPVGCRESPRIHQISATIGESRFPFTMKTNPYLNGFGPGVESLIRIRMHISWWNEFSK